jgi:hypothetical protein
VLSYESKIEYHAEDFANRPDYGPAVRPRPGKHELPLHIRQTGRIKGMVRHNPGDRLADGRTRQVRLEGKSTGFGHNPPENDKKTGRIAILCISILLNNFAISLRLLQNSLEMHSS